MRHISASSSICDGQSTQLCAPTGNGLTYLWSNGATGSCITVSKAGTYSVTVTNSSGCSSNCSKCVTVNAAPTCNISITSCRLNHQHCSCTLNHQHCTSEHCTLNHQHCQCNLNHTHCFVSTETCEENHQHCKCTLNHQHCSSANCTYNHQHCQCSLNHQHCYSYCRSSSCASDPVTLTASGGSSYVWANNGATTASITVTKSGTYTVTVYNNSGCSSSCSQDVTIDQAPQCNISGNLSHQKGERQRQSFAHLMATHLIIAEHRI